MRPGIQVVHTTFLQYSSPTECERVVRPVEMNVIEVSPCGTSFFAQHDGHYFIYDQCQVTTDGPTDEWVGGRLHKTLRPSKKWYDGIIAAKAYRDKVRKEAQS